jgi:hypothetical protein
MAILPLKPTLHSTKQGDWCAKKQPHCVGMANPNKQAPKPQNPQTHRAGDRGGPRCTHKTPPESHTMAVDFQIKDQSDAWPRGSFRSLQLSQSFSQSPVMGAILSVQPQQPATVSKRQLQSGGLGRPGPRTGRIAPAVLERSTDPAVLKRSIDPAVLESTIGPAILDTRRPAIPGKTGKRYQK